MFICGQTFDFSPLNANDIERLETANEKMQRAGESELEQFRRGGVRICDHMRAQARLVMNCLDEVLGAGASDRLGLDENDTAPIYDAMNELFAAMDAEQKRYSDRIPKPQQPMNREQRRAQKKAQQRTQTAARSPLPPGWWNGWTRHVTGTPQTPRSSWQTPVLPWTP